MLRVNNIEAGYGGIPVLRGVTLSIERNESVAIIGANGAGKSTLVKTICGLLPTAEGRITHDDREIQDLPPHRRTQHGIAVVLENRHLFGELTVPRRRPSIRPTSTCRRRARAPTWCSTGWWSPDS